MIPIESSREFYGRVGANVSVVAYGDCKGVSLNGLQYGFAAEKVKAGWIGVSNVIVESPFSIALGKGQLLVTIEK